MKMVAVHRLVEHQTVTRGDAFAYVDANRALTYRELNSRANAVARALIAAGLKRGGIVAIRMERSASLLIALLGTLKAGGAYSLIKDAAWPEGAAIAEDDGGQDQRYRIVDLSKPLDGDVAPSPNLPILTRGSEVACVLAAQSGAPPVLIPHATIAALHGAPVLPVVCWAGADGPFDMWLALMSGATLTATETPYMKTAA